MILNKKVKVLQNQQKIKKRNKFYTKQAKSKFKILIIFFVMKLNHYKMKILKNLILKERI